MKPVKCPAGISLTARVKFVPTNVPDSIRSPSGVTFLAMV